MSNYRYEKVIPREEELTSFNIIKEKAALGQSFNFLINIVELAVTELQPLLFLLGILINFTLRNLRSPVGRLAVFVVVGFVSLLASLELNQSTQVKLS